MNLRFLGHDFITKNNELFCSDRSTIRSEDVELDTSTGEVMGLSLGVLCEINLCEGCYEMVILKLIEENERLKSKPCAHELARRFLEGE